MHGFSIYLGKPFDKAYARQMVELGYTTIFTSVQIPEEDEQTKYHYLTELLEELASYQVTYMIDINPDLLNERFFNILQRYHTAQFIIRIDNKTSSQSIDAITSRGYQCCLNASIVSEHLLSELKRQLQDFSKLCYCHNYYPRPDTGLAETFVQQQNERILHHNTQADIYAFVAGSEYRGPLYKGLPTLESTRKIHPIAAAQRLKDTNAEHILVGDPYLTPELAEQLMQYLQNRHFTISIQLTDDQVAYIVEQPHSVRPDNPQHVIRSQESRHYCKGEIQPKSNQTRARGAITVDNHLNGRYQGELQIIKQSLPAHPNINVIGHVIQRDVALIDILSPSDTFDFKVQKEDIKE